MHPKISHSVIKCIKTREWHRERRTVVHFNIMINDFEYYYYQYIAMGDDVLYFSVVSPVQ